MISDQEIIAKTQRILDACDKLGWLFQKHYLKTELEYISTFSPEDKIAFMRACNTSWQQICKEQVELEKSQGV